MIFAVEAPIKRREVGFSNGCHVDGHGLNSGPSSPSRPASELGGETAFGPVVLIAIKERVRVL